MTSIAALCLYLLVAAVIAFDVTVCAWRAGVERVL